jgi:hypothetical protein
VTLLSDKEAVMWWTGDWPSFAPWLAIPFMLICFGMMFLMMRMMGMAHICGFHAAHRAGSSDTLPPAPTSSHTAFDEYRTATLQRLEQEQGEFRDFLDRLRAAKDKSEFDAFMAERGAAR